MYLALASCSVGVVMFLAVLACFSLCDCLGNVGLSVRVVLHTERGGLMDWAMDSKMQVQYENTLS